MSEVNEKRYGYVYRVTNLKTGHTYIGMHRIKQGERFDAYFGSGRKISNAVRKHGKEAFSKEIIHYADTREEMIVLEAKEILREEENGGAQYNLLFTETNVEKLTKLTGVDTDGMFSMYFEGQMSTRQIADKLGVSQPTIVKYIASLKAIDDRFVEIKERMVRSPRTPSSEEVSKRNSTINKRYKTCFKCGNEFSPMNIKRHTLACGTMPKCEVCERELSKITAKRCFEHKVSNHPGNPKLTAIRSPGSSRKGGLATAHKRWHVERNIVNDECELCIQSLPGN